MIFIFFAVLIGVIYAPSLWHAPRSDQLHYIADVAQYNGDWTALALKTYDLNLSRVYAQRDTLLFRPLLYFIAGNEQYFFGYNFFFWQLAGMILFLILVWQLYKLLDCIRPGFPAVLSSAFFAALLINIELVTWTNTSAYMVALICLLTALRRLYLYAEKGERDRGHLAVVFWCFLAAVFIFEVMNFFCLLAGFYVWRNASRQKRWKDLLPVIAPCLIYACVSVPVLFSVSGAEKTGAAVHLFGVPGLITYTVLPLLWWVYSALFPWQFHINLGDRTIFEITDPLVVEFLKQNSLGIGLVGIAVLTAGWAYRRFRKTSAASSSGGFAKLLAGMIMGFPLFLIFGRNLPGRLHLLGNHWYYHSIFWLLFLVLVYVVFWRAPGSARARKIAAGCGLVFLICVNARMVMTSNMLRAGNQTGRRELLASAEAFVQQNRREPDFSFFIPVGSKGNPVFLWLKQEGGLPPRPLSILEAFYPQYFRHDHAKYVLASLPADRGF